MRNLFNLTALALALAGPAVAKDELPEVTVDGLQRIHNSEWAAVYAEPGADLSGYDQVIILEPAVAFKKDWLRDYNRNQRSNRASEQDMQRIRERMAKEFDEVFREVIAEDDGYPVVTEAGPTVLILRPAIVDLDPIAPADIGVGRSQVLRRERRLHEPVPGDLRFRDRRPDRQRLRRQSRPPQWLHDLANQCFQPPGG